MMSRLAVAWAFSIVVSPAAHAQNDPNLEETWEYISNAFDEDQSHGLDASHGYVSSVSFDKSSCLLVVGVSSSEPGFHLRMSVFLRDLDPSLVNTGYWSSEIVDLNCRERKECVTREFSSGLTIQTDGIEFQLDDGDRNGRAFAHLIRLCGGTEELF